MINKIDRCLQYKVCVLGIVVVLGGLGMWLLKSAQPQAIEVAPSEVLHNVSTTQITTPAKVYAPSVKKTLGLPKAVQENVAKVVLTATDLPKSKYERTVTTVLDTETGESTQYVETKPLKWFAPEHTGNVGAYVGFNNAEPTLRLQATQDLFTVKALTFGAIAAVDVNRAGHQDAFIGVGARYEW